MFTLILSSLFLCLNTILVIALIFYEVFFYTIIDEMIMYLTIICIIYQSIAHITTMCNFATAFYIKISKNTTTLRLFLFKHLKCNLVMEQKGSFLFFQNRR